MNVANELYTTLRNIKYDSLILGKGLQMLVACSQNKWAVKHQPTKLYLDRFVRLLVVNILNPAIEVFVVPLFAENFPQI